MNTPRDPALWLWAAAAALALFAAAGATMRVYRRRSRRRRLLERLERIAYATEHQVQVPDGMGGYFHVDHLLLTPRGVLILDTRRVPGLIFGGDQMSEWTVMARGRRYTFENPQPALYDRIAAVKALVGETPVDGLLVFSNLGKFAKGRPKAVIMLDALEVEFPAVERESEAGTAAAGYRDAWIAMVAQLRPSPHEFTNL
ncbi:MAG: NERD domain-containing protein [Gammaproteobacteria bacterium]|nr:NERD domain-containing protein [Gammaproteobacteria bacterium]